MPTKRPRRRSQRPSRPPSTRRTGPSPSTERRVLGHPVFAEPQPTPDPTAFRIPHPSDTPAYKTIDQLNLEHKIHPLPFPVPRGGVEPRLTLLDVRGGNKTALAKITSSGQLVFHATGDCGSTRGPQTQNAVTDKMISDFNESDEAELPQFCILLGDIVYSFGEAQFYYDQFYEPYRDYPAPILAAAGNHDGMISPGAHVKSLAAFLRNFCSDQFVVTPEAGGLSRTAQVQPGVFFTLEAPFLRILTFYSNTLEDPGVIADSFIGDSQLRFLTAALRRVKAEGFSGALLIADHHPPFTAGSKHGWSVEMLSQIDAACTKAGVWPHAFLSGHAHNYQRFTRTRTDGTEIPYVVCGNGGHNVVPITPKGSPPLRAPQIIQARGVGADQIVLENYDDLNYGYLRLVVTAGQLRIEYHPANDGPRTKAPDDAVTVDLNTRRIVHFAARDLGRPAEARKVARAAGTARARSPRTRQRHPPS